MTLDRNDHFASYAIRARAYELWLDAGRLNGNSLARWLQAEAEMKQEQEMSSDQASQPQSIAE